MVLLKGFLASFGLRLPLIISWKLWTLSPQKDSILSEDSQALSSLLMDLRLSTLGLQLCSKKNTVGLTGLTWFKTRILWYLFTTWFWTSHQCTPRFRLLISKISTSGANVLGKYIFVFKTFEVHLKTTWIALACCPFFYYLVIYLFIHSASVYWALTVYGYWEYDSEQDSQGPLSSWNILDRENT